MNYFSLPADFKQSTIDRLDKLNALYEHSRVIDTYGNINVKNPMESGRAAEQLPGIDILDLAEYIDYSKHKNIEFNYTLNAPTIQNREFQDDGLKEIKDFLEKLYKAGVRSLTAALPSLIEFIQALPFDFKIRASTLCQVTNANKAAAYKRRGLEKIVLDESITRNFYTIKKICRVFGDKVEIIVNPICNKNCTYRMFHYNQIACDSLEKTNPVSTNYYEHRCILQRFETPGNLLRISWVRPEDLKYYREAGVCYFKLQGRHTFLKGGDIIKTVTAYMEESFDGDLTDLFTLFTPLNHFKVRLDNKKLDGYLKPFLENRNFCENDCTHCNYCESFAQKCIDMEEAHRVIPMAREFYRQYDQYNNLMKRIKSMNSEVAGKTHEESLSIDFELAV